MSEQVFQWNIIGHGRIQQYLQKSIISGKIFHAYLFSGDQHLGKNALATVFVQTLLCESLSRPCGVCQRCTLFLKSLHPDFYRIQGDSGANISVQQIRDVQNRLMQSSFLTSYKAAIVEDAEKLSAAAANALLKIVEEPPRQTIFIFLTNSLHSILPTLRSRCHTFLFSHVPSSVLGEHIPNHILSLSDGKPGVALNLLADPSGAEESAAFTKKVISLFQSRSLSHALLAAVSLLPKQSNGPGLLRTSVLHALDVVNEILRDVCLIQYRSDFIKHAYMYKELSEIGEKFGINNILYSFRACSEARRRILNYVNPKLVMEYFILETHVSPIKH